MANVLVVDDDPGIVTLLQRIISKRGHQVLTGQDGMEGLTLAQAHRPDLIFTDINMPDLNGEELTNMLKTDPALANVPIVILSGTAFLVDLETTRADAILNKPFELKAVYELLERFLPGSEAMEQVKKRATQGFNQSQEGLPVPSNFPASSL